MKGGQQSSVVHGVVGGTAPRPEGAIDLLGWFAGALQRSRGRGSLAELDDRLLRDIGVSRAEALRESGKPFWR